MSQIVNQVVEQIVNAGKPFSSTDLARAAGISRQAVHRHLIKRLKNGTLSVTGRARAARYTQVIPLNQRLEVASAGSAYRLSARLLMMDVVAGHVTLDFTGVVELGEEFLEELFLVWAPAHPTVTLQLVHLPASFAPQFFAFAKKQSPLPASGERSARSAR